MIVSNLLAGMPDRQWEILQQEADRRADIGQRQHGQMRPLPSVKPEHEERRRKNKRDCRVQQRYEKAGFQRSRCPVSVPYGNSSAKGDKHTVKPGQNAFAAIRRRSCMEPDVPGAVFRLLQGECRMTNTITLTDHEAIRDWAAARAGAFPPSSIFRPPAEASRCCGLSSTSMPIRIRTGQSARPTPAAMIWSNGTNGSSCSTSAKLALVVPEEVPGRRDSFHEIVRRPG